MIRMILAITAWIVAAPCASAASNLLFNGDFELADDATGLPEGWRRIPLERQNVRIVRHPTRGNVLQLSGGSDLMGELGAQLIQTTDIPVRPNMRYRCTGFTRTEAPHIIIFVKGYGKVSRRIDGKPTEIHDRVYQMKKELPGAPRDCARDWEPFNLDFEIIPARLFSDFQHQVEFVRLKLYAYWPPGTCWLDDIRFEEVGPVPDADRSHAEAVTHTGVAPHLPDATDTPAFEEQRWYVDAANAWKREEFGRCHALSKELVRQVPGQGLYRLLAARAAIRIGRPEEALIGLEFFFDAAVPATGREVEEWQIDWARFVRAQALSLTGRADQAREILSRLAGASEDADVKALAAHELKRLTE